LPSDGMLTYISPTKVMSRNPGYSFLRAGFKKLKHRSTKGLLTYHLTQERFQQALETDLLADEIDSYLNWIEEALQTEDPDWYDLMDDVADKIKSYLLKVNVLKRSKNFGYSDTLFRLQHFFQMFGELDEELENLYYSFKWE
jgi:hypothetical protein